LKYKNGSIFPCENAATLIRFNGSPAELEEKARYLEEVKTALKVLLQRLGEDKKVLDEIADPMNLYRKTIEFHRKNIRTKIDIKNKKINLITYLLFSQ
jgi:DNA-binding NarL/FixJ family response regulator